MKFKLFIFFLLVPFICCAPHYKWTTDIILQNRDIANRTLTCETHFSSVENRPIYECYDAFKGDAKNGTIMIVGGTHGNEPLGRELILQLLADDDWRASLPAVHITWVPDMNPDGFAKVRRENDQGHDLNRAFPDHCDNSFPNKNVPEVNGMMALLEKTMPALMLSYHGGARVVVWGADESCVNTEVAMPTPLDAPAEQFAIFCANAYAAHDIIKTIEGSAWYPIRGSMQDWAYYNNITAAGMVVEMGPKQPTQVEGETLLASHKEALRDWIATMATIL